MNSCVQTHELLDFFTLFLQSRFSCPGNDTTQCAGLHTSVIVIKISTAIVSTSQLGLHHSSIETPFLMIIDCLKSTMNSHGNKSDKILRSSPHYKLQRIVDIN